MNNRLAHLLSPFWLYWPLLLASALATPLAFAPYRLYWLMPLLFGMLLLLTEVRPQHRVRSAYVWGLAAYSAQFYWINIALHEVAGLPQIYAVPLTLLLPAYLALFPALAFWLLEKCRLQGAWRLVLLLPALWTLTEYAREYALTGFGWGALGYSQIAASPLAGFAPVGGLHLVTLATALCAALLVTVVLAPARRSRLAAAALCVALLGGGALLKQQRFTDPDGSRATVALAQGNIPQTLKWDPEQVAPTLQRYYDQVAASHADIVILPETALPMMRQDLPEGIINQFTDQAQRNGSALALGIAQYTDDGQGYLNAVISLDGYNPEQPNHIPYYAKNHLVPFGEYIPLPAITGWLYRQMNMPLAGFSAGGAAQAPLKLANQRVAFNICYEDGFGDELIASAKQASLLANVSNMAWYGDSYAMDQHLQQSQARALELGRYMVRATNTGMTAIINPQGYITALLPKDSAQVLTGEIEGYRGETPYMRMGGSLPLMGALLVWLAGCFTFCRRRQ
nr:apolipoprotein N-acyltransferase [Neisseria sp. HSC-16F19]